MIEDREVEEVKPFELSSDELNKTLSRLAKGESVTIGDTVYTNPPEPIAICKEHYFEEAGMEDEFYGAAQCRSCINGRIYDTRTHKIETGKIVKK